MSESSPDFSFIRSLPRAPPPNDDPSAIRGNLSPKNKELMANILGYKTRLGKSAFADGAAYEVKLTETDIVSMQTGDGSNTSTKGARIVCEVTVGDGMLNEFGMMSGPCAIYLLGFATHGACYCYCLEMKDGFIPNGVSTGMDVQWYGPAPKGTPLKMIGYTTSITKRTMGSRAEIYNKETGKLLVTMTHVMVPLQPKGIAVNARNEGDRSRL